MAKKRKVTTKDILSGNISAILVMDNMPFVFFLSFLGLIYIANAHYAERKVREIQNLQTEVKHLNWEYMSRKSDLMQKSIESEVKKMVIPLGLQEITKTPYKIEVDVEETLEEFENIPD